MMTMVMVIMAQLDNNVDKNDDDTVDVTGDEKSYDEENDCRTVCRKLKATQIKGKKASRCSRYFTRLFYKAEN